MSVATALNLAIAMVEERPAAMRRILSNVDLNEARAVGEAQERLRKAVDRYANRVVYQVLRSIAWRSMRSIQPDDATTFNGINPKDAYTSGALQVELLIDEAMQEVEAKEKS